MSSKKQPTAVQRAAAAAQARKLTDSEALDLFLSLPTDERDQRFADTARAAQIVGLTRRTIEFWIEIGLLQAIRVGRKKYKVSLESLRESLQKQVEE
jgi:excisionase family DNA binding protein